MRQLKKCETIEVRLPHACKTAFAARCRETGRTMSASIRALIEAELQPPEPPRTKRHQFALAVVSGGAAAVVAIGLTLATPSATTFAAGPDFRSQFSVYDRNRDGELDSAEYGKQILPDCSSCSSATFVLPLAHSGSPEAQGTRGFAVSELDFTFQTIDWSRDGRISFDEFAETWTQVLRKGFASLDLNNDGVIDATEYRGTDRHQYQVGTRRPEIAIFDEIDDDGDGHVTWAEFTT